MYFTKIIKKQLDANKQELSDNINLQKEYETEIIKNENYLESLNTKLEKLKLMETETSNRIKDLEKRLLLISEKN